MSYLLGNAITLSTTITNNLNVAVDPATITLTVYKPDSTTDVFTTGQLTHTGTGVYTMAYLPGLSGAYRYLWATTTPATAADGEFVVTASVPRLVSPADVRAHLNLTDTTEDAELDHFILAATPVVEGIRGPVVPATYTERHDGGGNSIMVFRAPVTTVTSVTETWGTVVRTLTEQPVDQGPTGDAFGYTVDYETGRIVRRSFRSTGQYPAGVNNVTVTYTVGSSAIPENVRLATLELIRHWWRPQQGGRPGAGPTDLQQIAGYGVPNFVTDLLLADGSGRPPGVA